MDGKVLHRVTQIHPDDAYFKKTIASGIPALGVTGWWRMKFTHGVLESERAFHIPSDGPEGFSGGRFILQQGKGIVDFWAVKTEEVHDQ